MALELYTNSLAGHYDPFEVPIALSGDSNILAPDTVQAETTAEIVCRKLPGHEGAAIAANPVGAACKMKRFAYRVARRLCKLEIADIYALDLSELRKQAIQPAAYTFRYLTATEIRAAAADSRNDLDAKMAERLDSGRSFCYAAFDGDRLACYSWYALGNIEPEHSFGAGLSLPDDTIYMYKAFTLPEYRGQRLHQSTLHRAVRIFARMGIRKLAAIIEYSNWASVKSHERMGCRRVGRFWLLGKHLIAKHVVGGAGLGVGKWAGS